MYADRSGVGILNEEERGLMADDLAGGRRMYAGMTRASSAASVKRKIRRISRSASGRGISIRCWGRGVRIGGTRDLKVRGPLSSGRASATYFLLPVVSPGIHFLSPLVIIINGLFPLKPTGSVPVVLVTVWFSISTSIVLKSRPNAVVTPMRKKIAMIRISSFNYILPWIDLINVIYPNAGSNNNK